ncbi:MAG TPA: NAD(P)-dependent oxidoreductase [Vicinamibacterales bacterium]
MAMGERKTCIVGDDDLILVTGATGFIGSRLVQCLIGRGFRNLRCFVRRSSDAAAIEALSGAGRDRAMVEIFPGNLLSPEDCTAATRNAAVIFHLATSRDGRSFPDAFMNSVVTTRNLLDASLRHHDVRRFVNVSSLAVYTNTNKRRRRLLDESCPVETHPELRGDAYLFSKVKQDEIVREYGERFGIPYVIVRPGYVYGPGKRDISGRVGIGTFGVFLHLGGSGRIPFTYVDNCAEAIALAGVQEAVNGEVFNIVDDDLPSSRQFLRQYKKHVRQFRSLYVPHGVSYALCYLWERYSRWSEGQLAPIFNRKHWHAYWKKTQYSNERLKSRTGWMPRVTTAEGLRRYFEACRDRTASA